MISAEEFSKAGSKYLGRPYDRKQPGGMDCQDFYEQCLKDCGITMDLGGSNAWYRKIRSTGWTGSPEECKAKFGSIPKGATLFIHAFDGGEEKRGYHDGLGNASHIGIKTGTSLGAIHSSESKGGVVESAFKDKTIRNGGWNCVGLSDLFDYGEKINAILRNEEGETVAEVKKAIVDKPAGASGDTVNLRNGPGTSYERIMKVPFGTEIEVSKDLGEWCYINVLGKSGYMMSNYILYIGEDDTESGDDADGITEEIRDGLREALKKIDMAAEVLAAIVGRG